MQTQIQKLSLHLEEVYNGDPWYGDNITKKLNAITAKQANWHPHPEANSIAQLLKHMISWKLLVIHKLRNDVYDIEMNSNEDWDKNLQVTSAEEWNELVNQFGQTQQELITLLGSMQDEQLEQEVNGRSYNMCYLVNGIYEHNIYHLGQIGYVHSLYRKMKGL